MGMAQGTVGQTHGSADRQASTSTWPRSLGLERPTLSGDVSAHPTATGIRGHEPRRLSRYAPLASGETTLSSLRQSARIAIAGRSGVVAGNGSVCQPNDFAAV